MASQRMIECACCGQPGRLGGRGLIVRCESRIRKYHRDDLADYPREKRARQDMLADYATWRVRRPRATQQEIAEQMGVTRSALRRALDRDRARARAETTTTLREAEQAEDIEMGKFWDTVERGVVGLGALVERSEERFGWIEKTDNGLQRLLGLRGPDDVERENAAARSGEPSVGWDEWDRQTAQQNDALWRHRAEGDAWANENYADGYDAAKQDAEQARDYAERGPDVTDYWTSEEEDDWNNFRAAPAWVNYPDTYAGHPYNQARDEWAGRSPTAEAIADAEEDAYDEKLEREGAYEQSAEERAAIEYDAAQEARATAANWVASDDGERASLMQNGQDPTLAELDAYLSEQEQAEEDAYYERAVRENEKTADAYRARRDAHLSEQEERDLALSEDIAAGAVPVEYTDDGVRIGEDFHSHDSVPTAGQAREVVGEGGDAFESKLWWLDGQDTSEMSFDEVSDLAGRAGDLRDEMQRMGDPPERIADVEHDYQRLLEAQTAAADRMDERAAARESVGVHSHDSIPTADDGTEERESTGYGATRTDDGPRSEDLDQWRAPGTAGHDEEWAYWEREDSADRSEAAER